MNKAKIVKKLEDSAITAAVKSQMLTDKRILVLGIEVTTNDGIVKLSGEVNSDDAFYSAIQIAYGTLGVEDVDPSELRVVPDSNHLIEDGIITAKVKGLFLKEEIFGEMPLKLISVNVTTTNNVVHLKGRIDTEEEAMEAENLAKQVNGVKEVVNELEYE